MMTHSTPRTYERFRIRCWLTISVDHWRLWARAVDMSGSGALVESLLPVAVGSAVRIRSRVSLLGGQAHVRFCERRGWRYRIGLEFRRPLAARF
jgi:hypothetical protein